MRKEHDSDSGASSAADTDHAPQTTRATRQPQPSTSGPGSSVIPRWDVGFSEQQCDDWKRIELACRCAQLNADECRGTRRRTPDKTKFKRTAALPDVLRDDVHASSLHQGSREGYTFGTSIAFTGYHTHGGRHTLHVYFDRDNADKVAAFNYELTNAAVAGSSAASLDQKPQ